jgi:hypothetical protein
MHTCYLSYNASEDIGYVGYELGSGDSYYYGSSDHPAFLYAKRNGKLRKYILGQFDKELEARTAETYAIKKLREGGMNLYNRNVGGGGKDGSLDDFRQIPTFFRNIITEINQSRKFPELKIIPSARIIADNIISKIANKEYEIFDESIRVLSNYDYIQVRVIRHLKSHVRDLTDHMQENPTEFRAKTDPLMVIVDDRDTSNIKHFVIGGNHRIAAAIEAKWDTFPTVYINYSELGYDAYNAKILGEHDNIKDPRIEKPMDENDIKLMLKNFHEHHPNLHPNSEEFKDAFVNLYSGNRYFTEKRLKQNVARYANKVQELELASSFNFHQYDSKELEAIKNNISLKDEFDDAVVLSDEVSTLSYNGVGGICNMLARNKKNASIYGKDRKKTGVIFARLSSPNDINNLETHLDDFVNAMKIAKFYTNDKSIWKDDKGHKIVVIILPYKHESDSHPVTWKSYKKAIEHALRNEKMVVEAAA